MKAASATVKAPSALMSLQLAGVKSLPSTPSTYIWASDKSCVKSSFKSPMMATPPHSPLQSSNAVP